MRFDRRTCLGSFAGGAFTFGLGPLLHLSAKETATSKQRPFRRCVILWMDGGPSQLDTFDPKPGSPRQSIPSALPDVQFAETLPELASRAENLCLLRSVGSREGEHARATELLHTGFAPIPSFPRPSLGSMVTREQPVGDFPRYVTLGGKGFGPAFLGSEYAPFVIEDLASAHQQIQRIASKRRSVDLLQMLNAAQRIDGGQRSISARANAVKSVGQLLETDFPHALDSKQAAEADRRRYGDSEFSQRMLAARRLLEIGVPFVEVQLSGWDTHIDNQTKTNGLCHQLESPFVALIDDLQNRDLWDDTLVVWMGEFGRTPTLNGRNGRDHFPEVTPVVLAGGKLGGQVIGATNESGLQRIGSRHSVADLMATLLKLLGADVDQEYTTDFGSPTTVTDSGTPIEEIVQAAMA